ncbi:hypothetical protein BT96DRAFT_983591 [Gymnopus androsaceus JB14]|uniref:L domain-like protein n=1 Tax=Gymnopus androsaceus JB14 TaxID=1447944 RepID=A0A6A4ISA8_9AGAR|nr:hypothetical protein BT96DRAFT_983591 [Gymnopus androsaceus JB14]
MGRAIYNLLVFQSIETVFTTTNSDIWLSPEWRLHNESIEEWRQVVPLDTESGDDLLLTKDDLYEDMGDEERTSTSMIAEEGCGRIVQVSNTSGLQLQVQSGTFLVILTQFASPITLCFRDESSPNRLIYNAKRDAVLLTSTIPQLSTSLLVLDISANFLDALPPVLAICHSLEELSMASNPLRALLVFLADLTNLQVLIADATGIATLPDLLVNLNKLHMISARGNKMYGLLSWLCLLPALQALYVDGNPFQGPGMPLLDHYWLGYQ